MIFLGLSVIAWIVLIPILVVITVLEEVEKPGWAAISIVVGGAILYLAGGVNPIPWIVAHPVIDVIAVAGYVLVGAAWGLLVRFALIEADSFKRKVREAKREFCEANGLKEAEEVPKEKYPAWVNELRIAGLLQRPTPSNQKGRIYTWMFYWPFSVIWFVIKDPIRRAFRFCYDHLRKVAQRTADRVMGETVAEVERASAHAEHRARRSGGVRLPYSEEMDPPDEISSRDLGPNG